MSPDDMHFIPVYRFIRDIFDPATPCHVEAHLHKPKNMDGITVKTVMVSVTFFSVTICNIKSSPALLP